MAQHTPGPWTVEDPFGPDNLAIVPAGKQTYEWVIIATCSYDDEDEEKPRISESERDANARLIAAAPEMLAALKQIETATGAGVQQRMRAIACAAIANAIGWGSRV